MSGGHLLAAGLTTETPLDKANTAIYCDDSVSTINEMGLRIICAPRGDKHHPHITPAIKYVIPENSCLSEEFSGIIVWCGESEIQGFDGDQPHLQHIQNGVDFQSSLFGFRGVFAAKRCGKGFQGFHFLLGIGFHSAHLHPFVKG